MSKNCATLRRDAGVGRTRQPPAPVLQCGDRGRGSRRCVASSACWSPTAVRDRHPRVPRRHRTRHPHRRDLRRTRTGSRCTASRPTRPIWSAPAGADRGLSRHRGHPPRRPRRRGSTPSTRATASSPRTRTSPRPAPRPASSSSAPRRSAMRSPRRQGRGARARPGRGRAGGAGDRRPAAGRAGRGAAARRGGRLPGDAQGGLGRRRARHAGGRGRGRAGRRGLARAKREAKAAFGNGRGLSGKVDPAAPATSRCRCSATRTATSSTCSSATARCSAATRRWSSGRRPPISTPTLRARAVRGRPRHRPRRRLPRRRHRRVPDRCRHRRVLLHRGQSAHPGRAHRHRGGHRHRHRQGADPDRRGRPHRRVDETGIPAQDAIRLDGHALQCRITTEDPENNFIPDYGRITAYRGAIGFGIRLDGGTAYSGRRGHPLLRLAAGEGHRLGADARGGDRPDGSGAARVPHPRRGDQPRLPRERARATRRSWRRATPPASSTRRPALFDVAPAATGRPGCSTYLADVIVNGHPPVTGATGRDRTRAAACRRRTSLAAGSAPAPGSARRARAAEGFAEWMRAETRRAGHRHHDARRAPVAARDADAHLRHRCRSADAYARGLPGCSRSNAGAAPPSTSPCAS